MSDDPRSAIEAHASATTPTPSGADANSSSVTPHEPLAPRYGGAWRAMFGFVALMCFVAAAIGGLGGGWIVAVSMAVFGAGAGYVAVTGKRPADPSRAPASARFHELADPTRPLTDDGVHPGLPPAARPASADTPEESR